jgi:replicative DNA helicase
MAKSYGNKRQQESNQIKNLEMIGLESGRKPPQALDIEEAVLGALLLEPNSVADVLDVLMPECFYKEANRKIFKAISALAGKHHPIDIYTVAQELNKTGDLEEVGGPVYLSQLSLRIGAAAHLDFHTKVLLQKYIQREMISISYDVQKKSYDDTITVDDLLDTTQQKLFNLAEKNMKKETQSVKDILNEAIDDLRSVQNRQDGLSGVPSGYTGIDRVTYGYFLPVTADRTDQNILGSSLAGCCDAFFFALNIVVTGGSDLEIAVGTYCSFVTAGIADVVAGRGKKAED